MKATKVTYFFSGKSKNETIVLIHGYLENRHIWDQYHTLTDQFNLLIPDLPGFGNSPLPSDLPSDYLSYSAQLIYDLTCQLGIESFHLVGNSMGGYVAQELATLHPHSIISLCLISSTPFADGETKIKQRNRELKHLAKGRCDLLLQLFIQQQKTEQLKSFFAQAIQSITTETLSAAITGMKNRPDYSLQLRKCLFPIAFIYGQNDQVISINKLKNYLRANPCFHSFELPGIGHMAAFTAAASIQKQLRNFFTNKFLYSNKLSD